MSKKNNLVSEVKLERAERAIEFLAHSLDLSEKEVVEILQDGISMKSKGKPSEKEKYFIDEMKSTFDSY